MFSKDATVLCIACAAVLPACAAVLRIACAVVFLFCCCAALLRDNDAVPCVVAAVVVLI